MEDQYKTQQYLVGLVRQETKPAIGCTEIVAVAFAAANAKKYLKEDVESIGVKASLSVYKNGKSVNIPSTGEFGLDLTTAIGVVAGDPDDGLCVFKNVNAESKAKAKEMVSKGMIKVEPVQTAEDVYVEVDMCGKTRHVNVILKDGHTHIYKIEVNGQKIYEDVKAKEASYSVETLKHLTLKELREIVEQVPFNDIKFVLDGVAMNESAANKGLELNSGLHLGANLMKLIEEGKIASDPSLKARILTAAGADFRMGGGQLPITTSGGSGNQGIGVILPIAVMGEATKASDERLARALFFGHAVNLFVKTYSGKLAAICGCSIAAGIGASAGITWLLGGNDEQISGAIDNMLANLTGMICDGAKESCALKLSTSAGEAVLASYLACNNSIVPKNKGIIGSVVEKTVENIGILCTKAFANTDKVLIDSILCNE